MKLLIKTAFFHTICIFGFALLYLYLNDHFESNKEEKNKKYTTFTDFLLLSTTIQAGVGISDLMPISYFSKIALIVQQYLMILAHIITLYVFTL